MIKRMTPTVRLVTAETICTGKENFLLFVTRRTRIKRPEAQAGVPRRLNGENWIDELVVTKNHAAEMRIGTETRYPR
jgi:hypothetical protein